MCIRDSYASRMNGYATARQNGWMSANDIRELENMDRIPAEAVSYTHLDVYKRQVYGCAADRNQAKIVFDVAVDMVRFCPALSKRVKILESQKKITYLPTNSSYQVLSADVANKHGFNTHGVIFDELHTQPNRKLFDVMLQGSRCV